MNNNITWIIITDGYFIKIMVNKGPGMGISPLRDNDFEQTSVITYKLVTNKRNDRSNRQEQEYFIEQLSGFLAENLQSQSYSQLVFIAPEEVLAKLEKNLPELVTKNIKATLKEEYLSVTQDKLELLVARYIQ
jgi:protein required for attachment to host cells